MIPYGKQWLDDDDIAAVVEVLRSDWLTTGPWVDEFEQKLADYCGAKHAVAVSNGTVALHLACLAAGLGPGDEGITSPITFLASANCLLYVGARPVFADIRPDTWNIDPADIRKKLTPRTKAIIPVDFGGLPCDLEEIRGIANERGLVVIEDACHAIGARYGGRRVGGTGLADMVCFSFHPVKHITTGEGGAILTQSDEYAARLRTLRHHGMTKDPAVMTRNDGPWYYESHTLGYNGRITDFQCALGLRQLAKLNRFLQRRREIAARYREAFADIEGLSFQQTPSGVEHAYHLFVVHLDPARYDRRAVFEGLRDRGIGPQVHYVPVSGQPSMVAAAGEQGPFPHAQRYYEGCLSLPMYPGLRDDELERVIEGVRGLLV
jgi:UDP-4-amino-4,6-dideoxy-N-acetyl-beta-L-altrosamine transaminase